MFISSSTLSWWLHPLEYFFMTLFWNAVCKNIAHYRQAQSIQRTNGESIYNLSQTDFLPFVNINVVNYIEVFLWTKLLLVQQRAHNVPRLTAFWSAQREVTEGFRFMSKSLKRLIFPADLIRNPFPKRKRLQPPLHFGHERDQQLGYKELNLFIGKHSNSTAIRGNPTRQKIGGG